MKLSIRKKIFLGFIINILVVLAFGWISFKRIQNLKEATVLGDLEGHQQKVAISAAKILAVVNNIDNTSKGYVITGEKKYLDKFDKIIYSIQVDIENLRRLYINNKEQQQRIEDLEKLVEEKIKHDNEIIELKKYTVQHSSLDHITIEKDFEVTQQIIQNIFEIEKEEVVLFKRAQAKIDVTENRLRVFFTVLLASAIVLLIIVFFIIQYYIKARRTAEFLEGEEKQLLQSIIDNTSNSIFIKKINGEYILINREFENLIRKSNEEVKGKTDRDLFSKEIADPLRESDLDVLKSGNEIRSEEIFPEDDGPHIHSIVKFPLYDTQGKIYAIAGIANDITESKKKDLLLKESEERFRMLVEEIKDYAIFFIDPEGRIKTWNKGAERIKGYKANEIIGKNISTFYTPEEIEKNAPENNLKRAKENGRFETEGWRVRKDGSQFWADVVINALYNEAGELKGFAKVTKDVSERKKIEQQLKDSEEQLQTIFSVSPDALIVINDEGNIIRWNTKAEKIFGWNFAEVLGKPMHKLIMPEKYVERHLKGFENFLKTGEGPIINKTIEVTALNRKNVEFDIELTVSPATLKDKYIFIAFLKDISARKLLEKEIVESKQFLDSIVVNIPSMIFVKDAKKLSFIRLNKAGEKLLGYDEKDLIGKTDYEIFSKEVADLMVEKDKNVLANKELIDIPEEPVDTKRGRRWLHTQKIPITDDKGTPVYLLGISQDITERREMERKKEDAERLVRANEQRMKLILENIGEGVIVANNHEKIILSNSMAEEIIGVKYEPGVPLSLDLATKYDLYYPDEKTIFPAQNLPLERALKGESTNGVEIIIEDPESKSKKRVLMNGRPIRDEKNNIIAAVSTIRDVTQYKKLEEALEESEQKYRKLIGFARTNK